jgi:hypothetical protein
VTTFDNSNGVLLLTEGSACWDQVREAFQAAADFVEEQLALAASDALPEGSDIAAANAASAATTAAEEATGITAIIAEINKYTEGQLLLNMFSWDPEHVQANEGVGVCSKPTSQPDALASCWEFKKDSEGVFLEEPASYLVDLKGITSTSALDTFTPISGANIPAMFGHWVCAEPHEFNYRMRTTCARLVPKVNTPEDPTYSTGDEITAMTYFTSRATGRVVAD